MQVPRTETLAVKAVTPRSGLLPQHMAAGAVAQALAAPALAVLVVASGQRAVLSVLRQPTARAEVVMVVHRQA